MHFVRYKIIRRITVDLVLVFYAVYTESVPKIIKRIDTCFIVPVTVTVYYRLLVYAQSRNVFKLKI